MFTVVALNTSTYMRPFRNNQERPYESAGLVKNAWVQYIKDGGTLAKPSSYMTVK